jgi:GNAT superfamily N-acetyltransferase
VYRPVLLGADHDCSGFDSGQPALDDWLREHAGTAQQRRLGRTFVFADNDADPTRVLAYYTLAAHTIDQHRLTKKLGRGLPRQLPAVLLGRLALHRSLQRQGLGGAILAEAMARITHISFDLGARFVVVNAIEVTAAAFYQHYGFTPVPDQASMRLVQRINPKIGVRQS